MSERFAEKFIVEHLVADAAAKVSVADVFNEYTRACVREGIDMLPSLYLTTLKVFPDVRLDKALRGGRRVMAYSGMRFTARMAEISDSAVEG